MKRSDYTKKSISKLWFLKTIDFLILVIPVLVYCILGLVEQGRAVYEKVTLVSCVFVALVILLINLLMKMRLRSPIWIIVIGLYVALNNIIPLIICIAVGSVVDELFITPAINKMKIRVETNKEMDKRL